MDYWKRYEEEKRKINIWVLPSREYQKASEEIYQRLEEELKNATESKESNE